MGGERMTIWPGALKQEHVDGAKLFADRVQMLSSIHIGPKPRIAEIGVALGDFSQEMIDQFDPGEFHAYDIFTMHEWKSLWGKPTGETLQWKTHEHFYRDRFQHDHRVKIFCGDSSTELSKQPDQSYDLIYIDGAHDYDGVKKDTDAAIRKIRDRGVLVFNDYVMVDTVNKWDYGVVQVVNDLCLNGGWGITHFALSPAMFCDVALRRRSTHA